MENGRRIILASASPRRRELLAAQGVSFDVVVSDAAEDEMPGETPRQMTRRLACAKAAAVSGRYPDLFVLGADTTVVLEDGGASTVLGKPGSLAEATTMLERLQGREHVVISSFCLRREASAQEIVRSVTTAVRFRALASEEIARYVASGEGSDKAGSYAAQGKGAGFISEIRGSYTNVVGLPIAEVLEELQKLSLC